MRKVAWHQGDLDGFCGVYSWINAIYSLINLEREDCENLFKQAVNYMFEQKFLKSTLIEGMSIKRMIELRNVFIPAVEKYGYDLHYEKIALDAGNIKGVFRKIQDWLELDHPSVIVGIGGRIRHWSCIANQFEDIIKFHDKRLSLEKKLFVAGKLYGDRQYIIDPKEVIGIYITDK